MLNNKNMVQFQSKQVFRSIFTSTAGISTKFLIIHQHSMIWVTCQRTFIYYYSVFIYLQHNTCFVNIHIPTHTVIIMLYSQMTFINMKYKVFSLMFFIYMYYITLLIKRYYTRCVIIILFYNVRTFKNIWFLSKDTSE